MPLTPGGTQFTYSGTELDALAEARNYYAWVMRQFEPYLGTTVIEAGAGVGTFSEFILGLPAVKKLYAIEPATNTFPILHDRFNGDARFEPMSGYLSDYYCDLAADSVVAVNVLEHIFDDHTFLVEAREAVVPGGSILIFVPALPAIFGTLDVAFEHHRRYTKSTLTSVLKGAGWDPVRVSYMNMPGIAAWFVAGRILRKQAISSRDARTYDRFVVPFLSRLESLIGPPIGSNLVAIATRS
ncbi:MAG: methyltransferase domain-containing protein [Gemmatimonadaceae bacterium]